MAQPQQQQEDGSLSLIIGPMFAGKTSALLAHLRRYKFIGYSSFVITHSSDTRYTSGTSATAAIISHNQDSLEAHAVHELLPVRDHPDYKGVKLVAIEEAHFFGDLYDFVVAAVEKDKKHVICVGLNGDAARKPFGQILDLIPLADTITKIDALCPHCAKGCAEPRNIPGIFTRRRSIVDNKEQVLVGGADIYEAVCRKHYLEPV